MSKTYSYNAPYSTAQLTNALVNSLAQRFPLTKEEYGDFTFEYLGAMATLAVETIPHSCLCIFICHNLGENMIHANKILELCNIVNSKIELCASNIFYDNLIIKTSIFVSDLQHVDDIVDLALSKLGEGAHYLFTLLDKFTIAGCPANYDFMEDYRRESYTSGLSSQTATIVYLCLPDSNI